MKWWPPEFRSILASQKFSALSAPRVSFMYISEPVTLESVTWNFESSFVNQYLPSTCTPAQTGEYTKSDTMKTESNNKNFLISYLLILKNPSASCRGS